MQPHVVFLCEYGSLNGGEYSLFTWLRHLQTAGLRVSVVLPIPSPFAELIESLGVECWDLAGPLGVPFSELSLAEKRNRLADVLRGQRKVLVHANSLSMGRVSGPVLAELGFVSISHIRDIVRLSGQAIADLNQHTLLLAVSNATRSFHLGQGIDPSKCRTLYNGVDLTRFYPRIPTGYLRAELGIDRSSALLGMIGQIGLRKGQDTLFDALEPIMEDWDIHLLVIGERYSQKKESLTYEATLKNRSRLLPFAGRVHFLGGRSDISTLLPELTLLVHPAREEPLGRVLLESSASGCPFVATDVGGTREIVADPNCLVPPNDPVALRTRIVEMLNNSEYRQKIALSVREKAEHCFADIISAQNLLQIYSEISAS
ncbi:MAG: glycosyltransferase family 4 protein [Thermoguttaceae bacterium]